MSQSQPSPEPRPDTDLPVDDAVDTTALDRSAESIDEARGALGTVAANDDVTTGDQHQAGRDSQDPGEAAGPPMKPPKKGRQWGAGVLPEDHSGIVRRTWQQVIQKREDPHPEHGPRLWFVVVEVE